MTSGRFALRLAVAFCLLCLAGCVTAKVKMLANPSPPTRPDSVAVYSRFPPRYREVAFVEAHIYGSYFMSDSARHRQALHSLVASAASVGADGIMIRNFHPGSVHPFGSGFRAYRMGTLENSFSHMSVMHALAIEVP